MSEGRGFNSLEDLWDNFLPLSGMTYLYISVLPRVSTIPRDRPPAFCLTGRWKVTSKHVLPPLTQRRRSQLSMLSRHWVGTQQGNELTRNSSGNSRLQSSHVTLPFSEDRFWARKWQKPLRTTLYLGRTGTNEGE